ncbi:MAG TPA: C1 family peptidase, partial [Saprospiraceae bacterium]|nr:aminopeptidase [Lewinellaceae bacterium]HPK08923.1 C1 family peptidase [Saprospiraceae bacterium]HRX28888.1 C1 family peptidase [Saprospiraceae bacterium]
MKRLLFLVLVFTYSLSATAQISFTNLKDVSCTEVKNQQKTGTCWSFATTSFLESELIRQNKINLDLSEMFIVRNIYEDKAMNYVLRQGKANFSQGSLAHDLLRVAIKDGVVPQKYYSGLVDGYEVYDHTEMEAGLKGFLDGVTSQKEVSTKWDEAVDAILDTYLGAEPKEFMVDGKSYTPKSYEESLNINPEDYVSITSFTHHPFYSKFILEIPDNYSNGSFYNVPLKELMQIMYNAIDQGYSIAWDGDVSEKGFSAKEGIAILPVNESNIDFSKENTEITPSQELRQEWFLEYKTTDDHLMHLVGIAKDQNGKKYFKVKNSWGSNVSDYKGYLYMSDAYAEMKTMAIMVNKKAIPADILRKMGL